MSISYQLASTRFTSATYEENMSYRKQQSIEVIYGTPVAIKPLGERVCILIVLEMNNEKNRLEGIGLIKNRMVSDVRHKIYSQPEYNRFIYRGKYFVNREELKEYDNTIVEICDLILFKGKSHLKRHYGITIVSENLFRHWEQFDMIELKKQIIKVFKDKYRK